MRREQVVEVLREALLPLSYVNAAWLGGSDAFGRADELSDVDLQVDVDDGRVAATFGAVEAALAASLETFLTWQGASQMFSTEVMWGNRLNRWNTMPISARLLEISRSFSS